MLKLQDKELLEAVEQACRESSLIFPALLNYVSCDAGAVVHHGGLTPRIAFILNRPLPLVRRRLNKLVASGQLLRHGRSTQVYRWWPVGLWARMAESESSSAN